MFNTIILKHGHVRLTNREYEKYESGDTIWGHDSNPIEICRWSIEQIENAKAELQKYRCTDVSNGHVHTIDEYGLEYCEYDEDGFVEGSEFDLAEAEKKIWYAVMETSDDDWDWGSYDYSEAVQMLKEQGHGEIAVIEQDKYDTFCVRVIGYADVCDEN